MTWKNLDIDVNNSVRNLEYDTSDLKNFDVDYDENEEEQEYDYDNI